MSVSLISLRLEIAENYPSLEHLSFTAVRQKKGITMTDARNKVSDTNDSNLSAEDDTLKIDKCRGSRLLQDMTIETIHNSGQNGTQEALKENIEEIPELSKDHKEISDSVENKLDSQLDHPVSDLSNENVALNTISPVEVVSGNEVGKNIMNGSDIEKRNRMLHQSIISFSSGNHFVEVTKGLLHLYKENQRTTLAEEAERSEMLCILAVPAAMTSHDLLQFLAPVYDDIEHIRIIKENKPNQYMVLTKFRNIYSADVFYKNFNGTRFNSIEPEVCHLAFVAKVETIKESEEASLPLSGYTELPTCPVCLERMDESVEGILTILCNHSFHGSCLAKWGDTSCPVCRYSQTPELMPDNRCVVCGSQDSLWICLICGHIGCGRYVDGHAYRHYLDTQHTYAMQLGNNRVWDYAGDNYVHRLVQNKADGKPVELEPLWVENEEKMDSMQLEYTYLLTSQLEAQRHYFEDRVTRIETESLKQLEDMKERTKHAVDERKEIEAKLSKATKERIALDKKISQLSTKLKVMTTELKEEKEMNKCLMHNQSLWQQKLTVADKTIKDIRDVKDKEIGELQEQLRDFMFYLDAKEKLQDVPNISTQEIQDGKIVIGEASNSSLEQPKIRKKKHR